MGLGNLELGVDCDEDFADAELPEVFRDDAFDRDPARAELAAEEIDAIHSDGVSLLIRLELIERALRESENTSARARLARLHVRRALSGFDALLGGTDEARTSFVTHRRPAVMGM